MGKMFQTSDLFLCRFLFCLSDNSVGRGLSIVAALSRKGKTFLKVTLLEINSRSQIGNPTLWCGCTLASIGPALPTLAVLPSGCAWHPHCTLCWVSDSLVLLSCRSLGSINTPSAALKEGIQSHSSLHSLDGCSGLLWTTRA